MNTDAELLIPIDERLVDWVKGCFRGAFSESEHPFDELTVVVASKAQFGDYQCNDCMQLAKVLRMAPRAIAEKAMADVVLPEMLAKVEVAGPGFINLFLADEWLARRVEAVGADEHLGICQSGEGRTVVLDYSSPNVAKPMHIGHIRSTVIGSALDRLHRAMGYRVISDNHLGDWGTQFGIIIMGYRHFLDREALAASPVEELERIYVKSYEQTKQDPTWLAQCRAELVKLQSGDAENLALWQEFVDLSLKEFERIYGRLDVRFDEVRGESYYSDRLPGVIESLESHGLAKESEGALIVDLEAENLRKAIVRKSDGAFNYTTTDLATVMSRVEEFAPDRIVYVTDERQQLHFQQFFTICRKLGITTQLDHVWFGLMRLPDATFSTRQGNVIKLEALLDEAVQRARAILEESNREMAEAEKAELAEAIGIGAVKYADLSQSPQTMVTFTWEKALALDGNSGPYLQYAHARICSVRDKYTAQFPDGLPDEEPIVLGEAVERQLAFKLLQFGSAVARATKHYKPSTLADYLYDLSQTYSSFYQNVPFLKAEAGVRESRIRLCGLVAAVLSRGLELLSIRTPERI